MAVDYADFPAMEWTVYFNNMGAQNTPILEQVHGLDTRFVRDPEGEFCLHYLRGDYCAADGYRPYEQALWYNLGLTLAPLGGRGTNSAFPYYNLQMPGGGLFLAVGWPGQWAATFQRDAGRELGIVAGQELTHVSLRPGEDAAYTPDCAAVLGSIFKRGGRQGRRGDRSRAGPEPVAGVDVGAQCAAYGRRPAAAADTARQHVG